MAPFSLFITASRINGLHGKLFKHLVNGYRFLFHVLQNMPNDNTASSCATQCKLPQRSTVVRTRALGKWGGEGWKLEFREEKAHPGQLLLQQ